MKSLIGSYVAALLAITLVSGLELPSMHPHHFPRIQTLLDHLHGDKVANSSSPRHLLGADPEKVVFCQAYPSAFHYGSANIFTNPDFTDGTGGWFGFGYSSLKVVRGPSYTYAANVNRQYAFSGPAQTITLEPGEYEIAAWLMLNQGVRQYATATFTTGNNDYLCIGSAIAKSTCWTKLMGGFTVDTPTKGSVYISGPTAGTELWIANTVLIRIDPKMRRRQQNARIRQLRMRDVLLQVTDSSGQPLSHVKVKIDQTKSEFPFGSEMSARIVNDRYFQKWYAARFNWAVFRNELKWYHTEATQGVLTYEDADQMLAWCAQNNIKVRGHNIFWADPTYVQGWVKALDNNKLSSAIDSRLQSVVNRYKGRLQHWDVNNEMLHGHYYSDRLGNSINSFMFETARQIDPFPKLFVNDYNTVENCDGVSHPEYYLASVWSLILRGAKVGGVGVEAHFGSRPQGVRIQHDLNQLAVANLPVFITELDFNEPDGEKQSEYLEVVMREAFSHPAVQGILFWSAVPQFESENSDPRLWVDYNWNEKPIAKKYVRLRKEWSTHINAPTSSQGELAFRGFFGLYRARILVNGKLVEKQFYIPEGSSKVTVSIQV